MNKRLVITGMGAVTPIGIGTDTYWENLLAGKTGIDYIQSLDIEDLPVKIAGEVRDFDPKDYMPRKKSNEMDRFMQMTFAAAAEAIEQSGLEIEPYRTGITVGTALNGIGTITETERTYNAAKIKKVGPRFLAKSLGNICASHIAIAHDIKGPSMTLNTACASGGDSIALSAMLLRSGMADVMVATGGEAGVNTILIQSLASAMALSTANEDPAKACRPFDSGRTGFVIGEGAGALVLETEEHALARGAKIYAVLEGWGNNTDAYHPVTPKPDGEGEILCMKQALEIAGIEPGAIGYINAHGTATHKGDVVENNAIKSVFGADSPVRINSTKASTGHMMGAGGITEVITCVKAIETGIIPATLNLENKDQECDMYYVSSTEKDMNIDHAMSNAFGFGGQNSSIIVGKHKG